jgi:hypothetical protein
MIEGGIKNDASGRRHAVRNTKLTMDKADKENTYSNIISQHFTEIQVNTAPHFGASVW